MCGGTVKDERSFEGEDLNVKKEKKNAHREQQNIGVRPVCKAKKKKAWMLLSSCLGNI